MKVKLKAGRRGYPKDGTRFSPVFDAVRHRRLIIEGAALFSAGKRAAAQKENRGSREDESNSLARMGKILAGGGAGASR